MTPPDQIAETALIEASQAQRGVFSRITSTDLRSLRLLDQNSIETKMKQRWQWLAEMEGE